MRATAAILLLTAACATLRIDVDVYKGPLSNTDEVQIQQTIAMAVGAKPLLVQLRDSLEQRARPAGKNLRDDERYLADYIDVSRRKQGEPQWFRSADAERINAILHLYADLKDSRLEALRVEADNYAHLYNLVNSVGDERKRDAAAVDEIAKLHPKAVDSDSAIKNFLLPDHDRWRCAQGLLEEVACGLQDNGSDVQIQLPTATGFVSLSLKQLSKAISDKVTPKARAQKLRDICGANVMYEFLATPLFWDRAADHLLEADNASTDLAHSVLRQRGLAIGKAFRASRESLRRMFDIAVELAREEIGRHQRSGDKSTPKMLVLAADLMSIRNIRYGKTTLRTDAKSVGPSAAAAWPKIADLIAGQPNAAIDARKLIEDLLGRVSDDLLLNAIVECDSWVVSGITSNFEEEWNLAKAEPLDNLELQDAISFAKRRYGVVGGPDESPDTGQKVNGDTLQATVANAAGSHGLDGGRLAEGLDSLLARYLTQAASGASSGSLAQLRQTVFESLTQFGEKLRVMAGFQSLVGNGGDIRGYVNVLASVATAMLSQIDSLHRAAQALEDEQGHDSRSRRLREMASDEHHGWNGAKVDPAQSPTPSQTPMPTPPADNRQTPAQVLEQLVAKLRYLQVRATLANGPEGAETARIKAALDLAYDHLTGAAELKPAMEYLRNSSPAWNLQQTPLLLTDRILGEAHRSKPDTREQAIELDQQYWQNVNSVSVDGVGTTQYVLAKDDVGNWQVKSVSNDVTELVQTLGSLASFGFGGGLSPLARVDAARVDKLLAKARSGQLDGPDKAELEKLRGEQRESTFRNELLLTHVQNCLDSNAALVARMLDRSWVAKEVWTSGIDDNDHLRKEIQDALMPDNGTSPTDGDPPGTRLTAARLQYETVDGWWLKQAQAAAKKELERQSPVPTKKQEILDQFQAAIEKRHARFAADRRALLEKLRNQLEVLSAPPPAAKK